MEKYIRSGKSVGFVCLFLRGGGGRRKSEVKIKEACKFEESRDTAADPITYVLIVLNINALLLHFESPRRRMQSPFSQRSVTAV